MDFEFSLINSNNLYRIAGNAGPYERRLLFRLNGSFQVELVRFNEKKGVEVELSLLARDRLSGEWLVCEGIAKLASNFPPSEILRVIERIPNARERPSTVIVPTSSNALDNTRKLGSLSTLAHSGHEPSEGTELVSPLVRVEEIDAQIRALLAQISVLNDEKTHIFAHSAATNGVQGGGRQESEEADQ